MPQQQTQENCEAIQPDWWKYSDNWCKKSGLNFERRNNLLVYLKDVSSHCVQQKWKKMTPKKGVLT